MDLFEKLAQTYRGAIFDFDGTVADTAAIWRRVDEIFFARRGKTFRSDYPETMSLLGFEAGARYTVEEYGLSDTPAAVCREWRELSRELYRTDVTLRPGVPRRIAELRAAGMAVGLATTNAPEVLAELEPRIPLGELFPVRVHACELERPTKETPAIYLECARRMDVEARTCVVFEDLAAGIVSAKAAGMGTVAVLSGEGRQDADALARIADHAIADWR